MNSPIKPGLLILHGNRLELLGDAVFEWVLGNPLGPLEEEIFLVQNNGMAEWVKMTISAQGGICAATQVELPGRFLWSAYRQVLGRAAVPSQSALDKSPLTWRLMRVLPTLVGRPGFEPLAGFLERGGPERRLQLAQRLADLYDQYQVYRSDWLAAWAGGDSTLPRPGESGPGKPLPPEQAWQAALWRELLEPVTEQERASSRPQLHQRFVTALDDGAAPVTPLPRRVVVFGMTHLPMQTLQGLAALSHRSQVLLAVLNPCRFHWADIIDGREFLRAERHRHPLRGDRDLSAVSLDEMHVHANPLLAAWGRQARDFVRQLDAFDDSQAVQRRLEVPRVDLFDEEPAHSLLQQVQAAIRDLLPLAEHPHVAADAADRSIVFHLAHSAQREVEILHDQLLQMLANAPPHHPLNPRDIVVMVPDIEAFTPAIRSVFGQYSRTDERFIPYDIADLQERGHNPLLAAVDWLLRVPQERCTQSEVRDLLDVPAVAGRFGLAPEDLPRLTQWIEGAGIRWGLDLPQRSSLDLGACGEQNTWIFGLRRMLLGYASGDEGSSSTGTDPQTAFGEIEPYAEVGGLDAAMAGALAALVDAMTQWWSLSLTTATPLQWALRVRQLIEDFAAPSNDIERLTVTALHNAIQRWLDACESAEYEEQIPLSVAREALMAELDEPGAGSRFRAGGVTLCTLMPMRAIPFEVVCLLGMNEGDYPRPSRRSDFDLMGLPGQARPGDRSRRDDDRELMLEALLSARRTLYISWTGRSLRDNSEQPPSVLVSQFRDYLTAGWDARVLEPRTTEHPLQPFSRRYFEVQVDPAPPGEALFTFAREWRLAHAPTAQGPAAAPASAFVPDPGVPLTIAMLARFLKNPVREFFRRRLNVIFQDEGESGDDDEAFALDGLETYGLLDAVMAEVVTVLTARAEETTDVRPLVEKQIARLRRTGRLPLASTGLRHERNLTDTLVPMLQTWSALRSGLPQEMAQEPLAIEVEDVVVRDWLDGVTSQPGESGKPAMRTRLELTASKLCASVKENSIRTSKLIDGWTRMLVAGACGVPVTTVIVGRDATVNATPLPQDEASAALATLVLTWCEGMNEPLPLACDTALALFDGRNPEEVYEGSEFSSFGPPGECKEMCLSRVFADYAELCADERFALLARHLYEPIHDWVEKCAVLELHEAAETQQEASVDE